MYRCSVLLSGNIVVNTGGKSMAVIVTRIYFGIWNALFFPPVNTQQN